MKNGDSIFIENSPGIGDLVMMTPYLRALKNKYPDAKITVGSTNPFSLQVIERIPYIDHVLSLKKGLMNYLRVAGVLKKQDYVVFNTYQPIYARMAKYLGVKHRAGNIKKEYAEKGWFHHNFSRENIEEWSFYQTDYFTQKFNVGLEADIKIEDYACDASLPARDEIASVENMLLQEGYAQNKPYVLLAPFGNTSAKLKLETVRVIIEFFLHKGYAVVLTGMKDSSLQSFLEEMRTKPDVFDMVGKTSIMEMMALMQGAEAVVALDSGPLHVACGLKKRTIGFFLSGLVLEWAPKTYCYSISLNASCAGACADGGPTHCANPVCADFDDDFVREQLEKALQK